MAQRWTRFDAQIGTRLPNRHDTRRDRGLLFRTCRSALIVIPATILTLSPAVADATEGRFGTWTLRCEQLAAEGPEQCFVFQNLVLKDSGHRVFNIAIGFVENSEDPIALVTLPLGISLPPGAELIIDAALPAKFPIERCMPAGCRAGIKLEGDLLQRMLNGQQAEVRFYDSTREQVSVGVSLEGFGEGLKALRN